jgi:hypothetical protein
VSIPVTELSPGDRVTLFCPNARYEPRRPAVFEAVLTRDELIGLIRATGGRERGAMPPTGQRFAVFLTNTADRTRGERLNFRNPDGSTTPIDGDEPIVQLRHCMEITDAGRLRDDEGRAVYIEARAAMGMG